MARHWSPDPVFTVLLVCTGNVCRSALAERLGRAYLADAFGEDADQMLLHSAGTQAVVGSGMHPDSALVLAGLGGDADGFRARQLVDAMAIDADLTLALTREHRRELLKAAPRALSRTFTLREAADLVCGLDEVELPGDSLADRGRALVQQMAAARSSRSSGDADDVRDPIGMTPDVHQEVGEMVAGSLLPILQRLTGLRPLARVGAHGSAEAVAAS